MGRCRRAASGAQRAMSWLQASPLALDDDTLEPTGELSFGEQ